MTSRLEERLAALAIKSPAQLRDMWERLYKAPAPNISVELLRHGVAYQLQVRALGGLPPSAERELRSLAAETADGARPGRAIEMRPGTRLVRRWGGKTWTVEITEQGYLFEARHYASLSSIAREITGAHWSGPRYFGLHSGKTKVVGGSAALAKGRTHAQR